MRRTQGTEVAAGKARDAATRASAAAQQAAARAQQAAQQARTQAGPLLVRAREQSGPLLEKARGQAGALAEKSMDQAAPLLEKAREEAVVLLERAMDEASPRLAEARRRAQRAAAAVRGDKPPRQWPWLVGAVATGMAIGAVVNAGIRRRMIAGELPPGESAQHVAGPVGAGRTDLERPGETTRTGWAGTTGPTVANGAFGRDEQDATTPATAEQEANALRGSSERYDR
jgi:hypothetical protein